MSAEESQADWMTATGHASRACHVCRQGHRRCDGQRPCSRCVRLGRPEDCCDQLMPTTKAVIQAAQRELERRSAPCPRSEHLVAALILAELQARPDALFQMQNSTLDPSMQSSKLDEIIRTAFTPSSNYCQIVDRWNEAAVQFDSIALALDAEPFPVFAQRLPGFQRLIRAAVPDHLPEEVPELQGIHYANELFEQTFGWSSAALRVHHVTLDQVLRPLPDAIAQPTRASDISQALLQSVLTNWQEALPAEGTGTSSWTVLASDGRQILCDVQRIIIRSPCFVPVFVVVRVVQVHDKFVEEEAEVTQRARVAVTQPPSAPSAAAAPMVAPMAALSSAEMAIGSVPACTMALGTGMPTSGFPVLPGSRAGAVVPVTTWLPPVGGDLHPPAGWPHSSSFPVLQPPQPYAFVDQCAYHLQQFSGEFFPTRQEPPSSASPQ